jgi:hypothetical protein
VLPGWGVVLGVYAQEFHARRAIDLAKASLSLAADRGQPRVIALKLEQYFNALLVGLDEEQAIAACLASAAERFSNSTEYASWLRLPPTATDYRTAQGIAFPLLRSAHGRGNRRR